MSWSPYRAGAKAIGGGAKVGWRLGKAAQNATAQSRLSGRARGAAGTRYLAPGDAPPSPTVSADYLDYRGIASWKEAANLAGGDFPVGYFADLRRGRYEGPAGLPAALLNRHALVVGPAGSGKTHSLIVPWIYAALAAEWSVVAVDVKGDLMADVDAYHQEVGGTGDVPYVVWDFMDPSRSHGWEWLRELDDDARLDAAVTAILGRRDEGNRADPYFYQRDYQLLRGLLRFTPAVRPAARTVGHLINTLDSDQHLLDALKRHPRAPGARDLTTVASLSPEDYARGISGVMAALSQFDLPGANQIMQAKARPRLVLDDTLAENQMLVVGARIRGGQASETLSSLMLNQVIQRFYERFGAGPRPVLLVVDEAPRISTRVDLAQTMEIARGAGVGVVLAMQDVAQIEQESTRSSIQSNAASMLVLPGASPKTVKEFGERLGTRHERKVNISINNQHTGWGTNANPSYDTELVPVLGDREIRQPPLPGRAAVLHVQAPELGITSKPILLDLSR